MPNSNHSNLLAKLWIIDIIDDAVSTKLPGLTAESRRKIDQTLLPSSLAAAHAEAVIHQLSTLGWSRVSERELLKRKDPDQINLSLLSTTDVVTWSLVILCRRTYINPHSYNTINNCLNTLHSGRRRTNSLLFVYVRLVAVASL